LGALTTLGKLIDKIGRWLIQLVVAVMVTSVTMQVVYRYFLKNPLIWAEELARYCLVWMTFIGAAVALRSGELACVDLFINKLPMQWRKAAAYIVKGINTFLLAFLLYYSIQMIRLPGVTNQLSPALRIPMHFVYLGVPLGIGLMLFQSILQLLPAGRRGGEN
jgi:TRAP-type C4-dicarboxylate transport system permease small subunit